MYRVFPTLPRKAGCRSLFSLQDVTKEEQAQMADLARQNKNLSAQVGYYKNKAKEQLQCNQKQLQGLFSMPYTVIEAILNEWFYQLDHALSDEMRIIRMSRVLSRYLGGAEGPSLLGENLNRVFNQILSRLEREVAGLRPKDKALFCYMAARLGNDLIGRLLEIDNYTTVSSRKTRLCQKITRYHPEGQDEYLDLIGRKNK